MLYVNLGYVSTERMLKHKYMLVQFYPILSLVGNQFIFLKRDWLIQHLVSKSRQKRICFKVFEVCLSNFIKNTRARITYARIRVFTDPYPPVFSHILCSEHCTKNENFQSLLLRTFFCKCEKMRKEHFFLCVKRDQNMAESVNCKIMSYCKCKSYKFAWSINKS